MPGTPAGLALLSQQEMDATGYMDKLKSTAKDWMVPDVIEHSGGQWRGMQPRTPAVFIDLAQTAAEAAAAGCELRQPRCA